MSELRQASNAFTEVARQAAPAVVYIRAEREQIPQRISTGPGDIPDMFDEQLAKRFFGDRRSPHRGFETPKAPQYGMSHGSGFIISHDGYILTNSHVVNGAQNVIVKLADGREFGADVVGTDERSDLAVIKIEAHDLPQLPLGDSDDTQVGQWVLAVGSPFGLSGTVTSGIVSATGRSNVGITDYEDFIQTDAAINPGNSGGPLLNLNGAAIGINTAIASRTGAFNGIGFAIPITMARHISDQLIQNGAVSRGYLGIAIQSLTPELAKSFGVEDEKGVLIGDVANDLAADKAGLKSGDVVVQFAGKSVEDVGAFRNQVASTSPGTSVAMTVLRGGKPIDVDVTIGELAASRSPTGTNTRYAQSLGLSVQPLNETLAKEFGYASQAGVIVTDVEAGSVAALAGLRPGMLIKEIDRQAIESMHDFQAVLNEAKEKDSVLLLVKLGDHARFVVLELQK